MYTNNSIYFHQWLVEGSYICCLQQLMVAMLIDSTSGHTCEVVEGKTLTMYISDHNSCSTI